MSNQKGFSAIEGLVILVVLAVIGFSGYYVMNRNSDDTQLSVDSSDSAELTEELPANLDGLKTIDEIETIAGVSEGVSIVSYKLESSDSKTEYVVILSSGKKLVIDARTGEILSEEETDVSGFTGNVPISISLKEAYALAASRYQSPVKEIEFEVEDTKATYKVEYVDGSKVEIDASTGSIVKSETKDENYEDKSDEDSEDESEDEDDEDEDDDEDEEDERES